MGVSIIDRLHNPTMSDVLADDSLLGLEACNDVVIALSNVTHLWEPLGTHLGLYKHTIDSIGAGNGDHFHKLSSLISSWLRRERAEHRPSWKKLCDALVGIGQRPLAEKIAAEHGGKGFSKSAIPSAIPQLPVAVPVKQFDVQKVTFFPNASAREVIRVNAPAILNGIANFTKFGADLVAMELVSQGEAADLASMHGISDYEKSNRLMSSLQRGFKVKDDPEKLRKLCIALQRQEVLEMNELVEKMLLSIGTIDVTEESPLQSPVQSVKRPKTTIESTDHPEEPVGDCSKGSADNDSAHVKKIKQIFSSKEGKLKSVFSDNLQSIAKKMAEAGIISETAEKNPSYDALMNEFFEGLDFLTETNEIEEECSKFLGILKGFRGPISKSVGWFQKELKECGYSVNIKD